MTYTFHVVVEREAHQWRAYCPAFESYEASTEVKRGKKPWPTSIPSYL
jgi:hypothetical protein